jgi:hypothetical protein
MARIKNQVLYPLDQEIDLEEYIIGTNSGTTGTTLNYKLRHLWSSFAKAGPQLTILYYDVDTPGLYDFHGGNRYNAEWMIIRYDKSNVANRLIAEESSNPIYNNIHDAWTNKDTLTYI